MGYGIDLLPAEHGDDPGEWLEEMAEVHDEGLARQHADAVLVRRPELELGGPYSYGYQLTLPEESGFPLDVGLHGTHASISVAFWDLGDRADELAEIVVDIVEALEAATGWVAYDEQEDRIVRSDEVRELFGSGHAHGVGFVEEIRTNAERPRRKRRFGLF